MPCQRGCFSCPCREELLRDAVEALTRLVNGVRAYRETLSQHDKLRLHEFVSLGPADAVIKRARRTT